jgi:chaperonin GroES
MIDAQDQRLNLEYLERVYFHQSIAKEADEMLRQIHDGKASIDLGHLLRDHKIEAIADAETHQRNAFDFLLAYYDILEIACLTGYVSVPLPREIASTALKNLAEPALVRYYEEYYPILLPTLFRMRLQGKWTIREDVADGSTSGHLLFNEFLGLVNVQRNDDAMETFLWFLDDGWIDGYCLNDTLLQLRNPSQLVDRFLKPPPDRNALDLSLRGVQSFLTFCIDLDDLLQRSAGHPLLQSAQWYYYAYWFKCIQEQVGSTIDKVITQISQWSTKRKQADQPQVAKHAIRDYVSKVRDVLKRLCSGEYGESLGNRAQEQTAAVQVLSIRPLNDRVVVRRLIPAETTRAGILLPDVAQKKSQQGTILAVGDGRLLKDGSRQRLQIREGDTVIFTAGAGEEVKESVLVMREEDILAILA